MLNTKKQMIIAVGIVVSVFIGSIIYLASQPIVEPPKNIAVEPQHKILLHPYHGESMLPTIQDGATLLVDYDLTPKVGDIITLHCNEVCNGGHHDITKRLIKIDANNCYWLQGDNQPDSWDSIDYGWVCPDQRELWGVVIEIR